jgi:PAS domain S-box-containing protein
MDDTNGIGSRRKHKLQRYEAILETIDDVVFIVDGEWTIDYANESALSHADTTLEDLCGTPVMILAEQLVVGGDIQQFEAALERVFADDVELPTAIELELDLPTGEGFAEYKFSPRYDDKGVVTSVVVVARDVTGRVQQEKQFKQRDEQLRRLHDVTRDLLSADTSEAVAEMVSDAADDILDFKLNGIHFYDEATGGLVPVAVSDTSRELLGKVPVIDDGLAWESFQNGEALIYDDVREAEKIYNPETPMRSEMHLPLGGYGVLIVSSPETDAFADRDVELARILAANTEAALERITHEQELAQQNERLDEFVSVVSHDLRNPLNVAMGQIELARGDCDSEHLDTAASAHDRMDTLIDDLLTLAQEGEAVDDVESVHVPEVLNDCWQTVPTADATLVIETDQTIRADQSRFQQLLENLIRNAVDHGGKNVTVTVGTLPDGFYVADDGPGIPNDEYDTVFEMGYSTATRGNGFGLSIVKEIADAHGWDISVADGKTDGTRFEITGVVSGDE